MSEALLRPLEELAADLAGGRIRARQLAEEAIANHERHGGGLLAYSQWAPAHALQCAAAADAAFAAGSCAGPLQGIPVSIKDLFAHPGFATFAGSPRRLPPKFEIDGPVVAGLRRQLAVVTGKTHMVEFAFGGTGHNSHYGTPRNPWDPAAHRSPGGSSSGAGVSLCEGSALLALGTDTAASVRLPASMTGNAGLKLTRGRWSTEGIVPLSFSYDTPGILSRSMADAAFGFAALDARLGDAAGFMGRIRHLGIDRVRIGLADEWFWEGCENGIAETVKRALDELAGAGALLASAALPEAQAAYEVYCEGGTSAIELRAFLDAELPEWIATIDPVNAPRVAAAADLSARDYLSRLHRLHQGAKTAVQRFEDVDVLAAPTVRLTPFEMASGPDTRQFWEGNRGIVRNLVPVNSLELCAVTLPVGLDRLGMPVGLQLIAKGGDDERLIAIACAAERVLGTPLSRIGRAPMCGGPAPGPVVRRSPADKR